MNDKSQRIAVLKHLQMYGKITSMEAFRLYGITRLSSIIFKLRTKQGLNIETNNKIAKNRYGNRCAFAEYIYHEGLDKYDIQ